MAGRGSGGGDRSGSGPPVVVERVRAALGRWRRRGVGPGLVVAVSGGSDSVGLLRLLAEVSPEQGWRLSVAHLDHGVRGASARADALFVAALAEALGLPFDLGHWRPEQASRFEAEARRARYGWLAEVARARGASAVAVGHTRDDQAETILHRILRGTGPAGLSGMPRRRPLAASVELVRPLLTTSRAEVRAYLAAIGQEYREDATNADLSRTRARIRHNLLPKLASEYNPRIVEALVRLGHLVGASHRVRRRHLARLVAEAAVAVGPEAVVLRTDALTALSSIERAEVVRLAWQQAGWPERAMTAGRWRRLARRVGPGATKAGGRFSVGGGIDAWISADRVRLAPSGSEGAPAPPSSPEILAIPGEAAWGSGRVVATLDPDAPRDETIDRDRVGPSLTIRAPQPGDRFAPLGLDGRSMSLNDFFRGRRLSRAERARVPVVVDDAGIVWVVGHRIADRVKVTAVTQRTLGLRWEGPEGRGQGGDCR